MSFRRSSAMTALLAAAMLCVGLADQAQARVFVGVGVGVPYGYGPRFYGPPVYGPPIYLPPPPVYYSPYYVPRYVPPYYPPGSEFAYVPPQAAPRSLAPARGYAQSCRAGRYVCPLADDSVPGDPCDCPSRDGGLVPGRAR